MISLCALPSQISVHTTSFGYALIHRCTFHDAYFRSTFDRIRHSFHVSTLAAFSNACVFDQNEEHFNFRAYLWTIGENPSTKTNGQKRIRTKGALISKCGELLYKKSKKISTSLLALGDLLKILHVLQYYMPDNCGENTETDLEMCCENGKMFCRTTTLGECLVRFVVIFSRPTIICRLLSS